MRKKAMQTLALLIVTLIAFGSPDLSAQSVSGKGSTSRGIYQGIVVDDNNEPLPGVTVTLQGSNKIGTTTNANGKFMLTIDQPKATLHFSYVGMKPREVKMNGNGKEVAIQLENDAQTLAETVVNGIYTRNIESFTGSVSTFDGDQLKAIAPQGIIKSLAILDPSIILTESTEFGSNPNQLADISINGKMNVQALSSEYETNPNQPLFVLDGFESDLQTISDLNMDRIESISILKDASATAIYGSKAANGVIVVETKKPSAGRLRVSYNGSLQVAWADLSDYNLMNAAEKLQYELLSGEYAVYASNLFDKIIVGDDGLPVGESQRKAYMERLKLVQAGYDTYWMNEPLRTAYTQNHNVYIDGGDTSFRYGAGISYGKTEGVMKKSGRDVLNGNIMLSYRVNNLNFTNQTTIGHTASTNETVPFSRFVQMDPFYGKRTEDGEIAKYVYKGTNESLDPTVWNPLWDFVQNSYNKGDIMSVTDNFQFEWRASNNLRLRGAAQYSSSKTNNEVFVSPEETSQVQYDKLERGTYDHTSIINNSWSARINASYGANWGVNTLNAVAGAQFQESHVKYNGYSVQGFLDDMFSNPNFAVGYPEGGKPFASDAKSRNMSFYGNLNYAYDMRYLLDLNITRSGASQFGIDNPFTNTWSVGIGWNIHNENWFKSNRYVSYLKLNASYGNPGNQNYDAKLSTNIYKYYTAFSNPFGLATALTRYGNKGLEWQRTKTFNVGLTATMFNNRLNLNANYQTRKTNPLLVSIELPSSTGVTSAPMNIGGTDNRSFSATATAYILRGSDFNWYVSANVNHNTTKYYKIGNSLEQFNEEGRKVQSLVRMYDGASTTGLYAVRSMGIDPATGNEVFLRKDGTYTQEWNSDDEVLIGDSNPDFTGSFSTSFLWKGFSVAAAFTYRTGGDVFLSTLMDKVENISDNERKYNQDKRALYDRWKKPGDIARYKRIDDTSITNTSSRFVAKEHTVECSSISIGYRTTSWPFMLKSGLTSIDLRAYMNDIFRISNIKEERGLSYPFQRSVSFSLGLGF